jgi:hypothetical protein
MAEHERARRLALWEECAGLLEGVQEVNSFMIATIASHEVIVPEELESELRNHTGQRIALLRTDDGYSIRQLKPRLFEFMHVHVHLCEPISEVG